MKFFLSLIFFLCLSSHSSGVDLQTVLVEIENPKLDATILPMQVHQWPLDGVTEPVMTKSIRRQFAKRMKTGTTPSQIGDGEEEMSIVQSGKYFEYTRDTHTATYERQFLLFERKPKEWVLAVTLRNSPRESDDWYTDIYFLCKSEGKWKNCTTEIFPDFSLEKFLKPGEVLNKRMKIHCYARYSISKDGTAVTMNIHGSRFPSPALPVAPEKDQSAIDLRRFRTTLIHFKWNKDKLVYEALP